MKAWMEVKGVTLEKDGVVLFPDAPSDRAVKHVEHLIKAKKEGYEAYIMFVIQMKGVKYFKPNTKMHPAFTEILIKAHKAGVKVLAYDCIVTESGMKLNKPVKVVLK
jgi:sugar fermentation stimulation protein